MRNLFKTLSLLFILFTFSLKAQTPQAFNYQGVARDEAGNPVSNRTISLLFSITHESPDALWSTVYQESHTLTTSNFGLFSTQIGTGTPLGWSPFSDIAWGAPGSYYLEVAIDMDGGADYTPMGSHTRLVSVPYALHAATCDEVTGGLHWDEHPTAPGAVGNTNENTVIVSPDHCCIVYAPETLNAALVVHGDERPTGAYFTTNNLGLDASAVKAEIIAMAPHSDPVAVRGKSIIYDEVLGNGGVGGEFTGGESGVVCSGDFAGIIARSDKGKAGMFEGDVSVSTNLDVNGFASAGRMSLEGVGTLSPRLGFEQNIPGVSRSLNIDGFASGYSNFVFNYTTAATGGGVTYQHIMSLTPNGRMALGPGNTDPGNYSLSVQQGGSFDSYGLALSRMDAPNVSTWELYVGTSNIGGKRPLMLYTGGNFVGQFNPSTGAYTTFSDKKFKRDIRPMESVSDKLRRLNMVSYQTEQDRSGARHSGVIAQELEQVFPEFVVAGLDRNGEELRSVDYTGLTVVALKAIQEQQERIEKLEKMNAELLARLQQLENRK